MNDDAPTTFRGLSAESRLDPADNPANKSWGRDVDDDVKHQQNLILIIDNYDSFVFNLARYFEELKQTVRVVRNNKINIDEIIELSPSHIVISPGPCGPKEAGICIDIVHKFSGLIPILGICLGHQVIGYAFGADINKAMHPMHGKTSTIKHNQTGLFTSLPSPITIGRYHSLIVSADKLPADFAITSQSEEGEIMSLSNPRLKLVGLQFHPESILTEYGHEMLQNFINGNY